MLSAVAENCSGTCLPGLKSSRLLHSAFAARRSLDAKPGAPVLACRLAIECSFVYVLLRCDQRPTGNGAANRAPSAKSFVDLVRQRRLFLDCANCLDLRIGDVAHCKPTRWMRHSTSHEAEYCVTHFGHIAQALKMITVVGRVESKKVRGE